MSPGLVRKSEVNPQAARSAGPRRTVFSGNLPGALAFAPRRTYVPLAGHSGDGGEAVAVWTGERLALVPERAIRVSEGAERKAADPAEESRAAEGTWLPAARPCAGTPFRPPVYQIRRLANPYTASPCLLKTPVALVDRVSESRFRGDRSRLCGLRTGLCSPKVDRMRLSGEEVRQGQDRPSKAPGKAAHRVGTPPKL